MWHLLYLQCTVAMVLKQSFVQYIWRNFYKYLMKTWKYIHHVGSSSVPNWKLNITRESSRCCTKFLSLSPFRSSILKPNLQWIFWINIIIYRETEITFSSNMLSSYIINLSNPITCLLRKNITGFSDIMIWYCFDNYFTYFVPVFKYCYSDSRNLWTVMRAGGLAP